MRLEVLLRFSELLEAAAGWEPIRRLEITGLAYDSRRVEEGNLFIAVAGEHTDGHAYLAPARERGATAAVVEHAVDTELPLITVSDSRRAMGRLAAAFHSHPGERLFTVGITGTNGKTTTMNLVRACLAGSGGGVGSIGTVEYTVGGELSAAPLTTPEAVDLQALLARMLAAGDRAAVMEVSSHALALGRIDGLAFDVTAFTNLGRDHLDFHPSMDAYLDVKKTLLTRYRKPGGTAVVNISDTVGARLAREVEEPVVTVGLVPGADVTASELRIGADGVSCRLHYGGGSAPLTSPLLGAFQVQNMLVAAGIAMAAGVAPAECAAAMAGVANVDGRMERLPAPEGVTILLDYAHKPDALKVAVQACREIAAGRVIVVFGCGGDRDRGKRPLMGRIAALGADRVIITSDNPRTEDPETIIAEIVAGVPKEADAAVVPDRIEAIHRAVAGAAAGDVVLIAGKGHERYQILGTDRIPFDERAIVAEAVAGRKREPRRAGHHGGER